MSSFQTNQSSHIFSEKQNKQLYDNEILIKEKEECIENISNSNNSFCINIEINKQIDKNTNLNDDKSNNENESSHNNNNTNIPQTTERLRNMPSVYTSNTEIVLLRLDQLDKLKHNNISNDEKVSRCQCFIKAKYTIIKTFAIITLIVALFFFIKWRADF